MAAVGSTLARRTLGRQLNMMRERARINQAQAARIIGISPQTMGRLEDGLSLRSANDLFMNALCDGYRVSDEERRTILALASEARVIGKQGGGWWRAHADAVLYHFEYYLHLEESVRQLMIWRHALLPGLLQTPEYRRALAWTEDPQISPETIEKRIEIARHRWTRLEEGAFTINVFLSEAALRDEVGGRGVMAEQMEHLLTRMELPNVSIRLVPFDARHHLGSTTGPFVFLEFSELSFTKLIEPPLVYVEGFVGDLYLEREAELSRYRYAAKEIDRIALDHNESRLRILRLAKEYGA
ncbi:helix-turn-helix domain-containing protein [Nocardia pseudobrasiliensis]|uniref:Helix-turn-helix protein n=1 Tax=Nocardia pseudobrasiliensis TaxID=45979 RepID=A0A370I9K9_9NOCA|nr:helix-turn-helix transcriptional regulator [Nocardia pseudobrasiliensis]RDI67393.1 helix-turn-helix protein [Nocardia pseudobrasiliensis]